MFSNPNHPEYRENITIKASPDDGNTWPSEYQVLLEEFRGAGYSCMSMIDHETVGILYEGALANLTFMRIPLRDIIGRE